MMTRTERSACLSEEQRLTYLNSILIGLENKVVMLNIGEE